MAYESAYNPAYPDRGIATRCPYCQTAHMARGIGPSQTCSNCQRHFRVVDANGRAVPAGSSGDRPAAPDTPRTLVRKQLSSAQLSDYRPQQLPVDQPPTIACPSCHTAYPLVAAMRGRSMRCRTCRSAFKVDVDGRVTAIGPDTRRSERDKARTDRLTAERRAQLATVRRTLSTIAVEALDRMQAGNEAVGTRLSQAARALEESSAAHLAATSSRLKPQPAVQATGALTRTARTNRQERHSSRARRAWGPVLSDSGRASGRRQRWLLAVPAGALLLVLVGWFWGTTSPEQRALADFDNLETASLSANQAVAQLGADSPLGPGAVTPIGNLGGAVMGRAATLPVADVARIFAGLKPVAGTPWWVAADHLEALMAATQNGETAAQAAARANLPLHTWHDLLAEARSLPQGELVVDFLTAPRTGTPGHAHLLDQILAGNPPHRLVVRRFRGQGGVLHVPNGRNLRVSYEGLLVKAEGEAPWSGAWQVARLRPRH